MSLAALAIRLGTTLEAALAQALTVEANALADAVRDTLATPPGGPHSHPWQQSGTLHNSVQTEIAETEAIIASTDEVALIQEHGTSTIPPRPSFAPLAAVAGPGIAHRLGKAATQSLRGEQ